MDAKRVVIVGAGPAGATLAYLLARRGIEVALLERHHDFSRTFRGDGLQPSGIDAFNQMGLGEKLMQLPKSLIHTIELFQRGRLRARISTERLGFIGCFIPQPAILGMLVEHARLLLERPFAIFFGRIHESSVYWQKTTKEFANSRPTWLWAQIVDTRRYGNWGRSLN
jgi:2-polyprenyl-6-methoxyphenol hydroxylase-like FAD-dependent oxidoreductase